MMMKKVLTMMLVAAITISAAQATPTSFKDLATGDGTTAVINGGTTYFYGFEVNPTDVGVDLDGVAASVGDFHPLKQPDYDLENGLATDIEGEGAEHLMRTDFGNSLWRAQFLDAASWTIEARVNITGGGTEGSEGVFGMYAANNSGSFDFRIGTTFVRNDIGDENFVTDMDNTGWHTWRVVKEAEVGFWFYRDGELLNSEALAAGGNSNKTFAGDYSSTLSGDWEMDYYALDGTGAFAPVPEPITMALLGLGGLLGLRRRK